MGSPLIKKPKAFNRVSKLYLSGDVVNVVPADPLVALVHVRAPCGVPGYRPLATLFPLAHFVVSQETPLLGVHSLCSSRRDLVVRVAVVT